MVAIFVKKPRLGAERERGRTRFVSPANIKTKTIHALRHQQRRTKSARASAAYMQQHHGCTHTRVSAACGVRPVQTRIRHTKIARESFVPCGLTKTCLCTQDGSKRGGRSGRWIEQRITGRLLFERNARASPPKVCVASASCSAVRSVRRSVWS